MKVDLYADIICPWCYIGEHRFFRAIAATPEVGPVEVTLRPFLLDPTAKEPRPVLEYLRGKFGERAEGANRQVGMIAKADGLQWDATKQIVVDTLPAHRVLRLALHEGGRELQHKVMQRLYVAHFAEGANVADPLVLAGLTAEAGMSRDRVEIALATGEESAEVQSTRCRPLCSRGATPFKGRNPSRPFSRFSGALPPRQRVRRSRSRRPATAWSGYPCASRPLAARRCARH
jgi:predicted DsbA family dithiol-disulfide isomerase